MTGPPLLSVRGLAKTYAGRGGVKLRALDGVSFDLARGETLGIVGESGCGKSTLARAVLRLTEPSGGDVLFEGESLLTLSKRALARRRADMQIIFQDPFGALNPRHKVLRLVAEPLIVHRREWRARVPELLALVGLDSDAAGCFAHEFSGGQRQRIAIARALALSPKLLVADEPVSALDVSIQSQIINLIGDLRAAFGLSMLFISHDLSVIRHVSTRIAVMYFGRIVEKGAAADVLENPAHPYTRALLAAVPRAGAPKRAAAVIEGETPDPANPPQGCAFRSRCRDAMEVCARETPELVMRHTAAGPRETACHLHSPLPAKAWGEGHDPALQSRRVPR